MSSRHWRPLLLAGAVSSLLITSTVSSAEAQGRSGGHWLRQRIVVSKVTPQEYQEPAYARGYADGYRDGLGDGRRRDRYDPADNRGYRDGDQGYARSYGSRDVYKDNYRAGFRLGYETGYRKGTR